jgi:heavy metal sensor kinase
VRLNGWISSIKTRARHLQSIRLKLAGWYALTVAVTLLLYSGGLFAWFKHDLTHAMDRYLHEQFELAETAVTLLPGEKILWLGNAEWEDEERDPRHRWIDVYTSRGQLLFTTRAAEMEPRAMPEFCGEGGERFFTTMYRELGAVRSVCALSVRSGRALILVVHQSYRHTYQGLKMLFLLMALAIPLVIGCSAGSGYYLARRALSPVVEMTRRARAIDAERLGERLPVENPRDELGRLALTFNGMFRRLETSFEQMRRFTADASHELRTPLTALRTVGEVYLGSSSAKGEGAEVVASMLEEADRMRSLLENLLVLSRADAGQVRLRAVPSDLVALVREIVDHLDVLAEEKGQRITIEAPLPVVAIADRELLRQAVINLVDNAVKYSPPGSTVRIVVTTRQGQACIEVHDSGPGIEARHQPHVFDRFYRVDPSRSRDVGGTGLGLAISRWAVELHGGDIELESEFGRGSTFRVRLPFGEPA